MHTGKLTWTFHTIPRPGEPNHETWQEDQWQDRSGANAWGSITVDVERGILFVGVGSVTWGLDGGDRKGPDLYGSTMVALDAATGELQWHFQTTHHDNWDYDPTAPPALFDVVHKGKKIPASPRARSRACCSFSTAPTANRSTVLKSGPYLRITRCLGTSHGPRSRFR